MLRRENGSDKNRGRGKGYKQKGEEKVRKSENGRKAVVGKMGREGVSLYVQKVSSSCLMHWFDVTDLQSKMFFPLTEQSHLLSLCGSGMGPLGTSHGL